MSRLRRFFARIDPRTPMCPHGWLLGTRQGACPICPTPDQENDHA